MAIESTLLIVKPDGVRRGLIGEVIRRVEAKGLTIEELDLRHDRARRRRGALRRASRQAVLRRARRFHHRRAGRRREDHRRGRDHLLAHADGPDEPGRGAARLDPRRLRHADRREHRPRLRLAGVGRARAEALLRIAERSVAGLEGRRSNGSALGRASPRGLAQRRPRARGHRSRRGPRRRRAAGSPTSPPARPSARDAVPHRLDLEVVRGDDRDAGGRPRAGSTCTCRSTRSCRGSSSRSRSDRSRCTI